ncbi:MAG: AMP-binding protein [Bryobacteraceae bacterium]|nr:AMP-binding protein [Bryobacteraceae bacterium]
MYPWLAHYSPHVPPEIALPTQTLLDSFLAQAPERIAVFHFDTAISYGEISDGAHRLAARLAAWGVAPGDRVAVSLQNDPSFLIAQYGVWLRGAILVPLSALLKQREIAFHLADSGAKVYICRDEIFAGQGQFAVPGTAVEQVLLESQIAALPAAVESKVRPGLDDIAYLVYTSGTTGTPKGSISLHRHIAFNAHVMRAWFSATDQDVIAGIAPLFHITGLVAQIGVAAVSGAPLILAHRFQAAEMLRLLAKHRATISLASITAYIALLREGGEHDLSSWTKCGTGGAPVPPAIVEQFFARFGVRIHNTYGLTEVNSPSHLTPIGLTGPVDPASGALAIGVPIPNSIAKIVDPENPARDLPPGEVGEIALQGPMLFAGYWNQPAASAQAFHDGFFLTGDIGIMDAAGWFYVVDRKKDMIVASGFKVWPREVEDVLYQHPAVREAAVVGLADDYRGETVKAIVALKSPATAAELIAFCQERLAAYKYPRVVEVVDEIPKTASGKFLRRAFRKV